MGPFLCLLSAACFGAMAIFGKLAFQAGVTPGTLLLIRFALAAVILTAVAGKSGRVAGKAMVIAFGLGFFGYAVQAALYFEALRRMDATLLSLVLYTYPLLVTLGAVLLGRDRLTPRRGAALAAASTGVLLVLLGAGGMAFDLLGVAMGFGCAVTYAAYILVSDTVVHRLPALRMSALVMTGATTALALYTPLTGGLDLRFRPAGWLWLGCIALVSTVLAMFAFLAGLRRTGPSTAAILSTFEPVVTTVLATALLGESMTATQYLGGALVLASVLLARPAADRPVSDPSPAATELVSHDGHRPPA